MNTQFQGNPDLDLELNLFHFKDPIMSNFALQSDEDELVELTPISTSAEYLTDSEEPFESEFSKLITSNNESLDNWDWDIDSEYWNFGDSTSTTDHDLSLIQDYEISTKFEDDLEVDSGCMDMGLTVLAEDGSIERLTIPALPPNIDALMSTMGSESDITEGVQEQGLVVAQTSDNRQKTSKKKSTTSKKVKCPDCRHSYDPATSDYAAHRRKVHEGIAFCFQCSFCEKGFRSREERETHETRHKGTFPFSCTIGNCDKIFRNKRQLGIHIKKYHSETLRYKCGLCKKGFLAKWNFEVHLRTHSEEKLLQCEVCEKYFRHESSLTYHRRFCCPGPETRAGRNSCPDCDRKFSSKMNLKGHQIKKHGRVFPGLPTCQECGFVSTNGKKGLERHTKAHAMRRSYKCYLCDDLFKSKSNLLVHTKALHNNPNKPFICRVCHKGFVVPSKLQDHMLKHSKIKNFTCIICNGKYVTKSVLKRHYRDQHEIENGNYPNPQ